MLCSVPVSEVTFLCCVHSVNSVHVKTKPLVHRMFFQLVNACFAVYCIHPMVDA
jgi:hypothetical protein